MEKGAKAVPGLEVQHIHRYGDHVVLHDKSKGRDFWIPFNEVTNCDGVNVWFGFAEAGLSPEDFIYSIEADEPHMVEEKRDGR